ncbi:putative Maebl [Giardia duodenalis]|uniref:Maebl n=1 Tax=Giardia intestinalis (strain ATCC 50803 / WB clone C6) TaxID=184922 RepID=A8BLZ2_GIAIC|nr:putative Maebl [Giardia intestinalis]KAE8302261.1 putative Maebl [Giardia intestinalis]|eukprot:XP_001706210.1 Maebl, putative [Giardia lamblia ATCC 50803]
MPYTDTTLFATKPKITQRMTKSNKPIVLDQYDLNMIRHRAGPLYPTESVSGRDDTIFNRNNIIRAQIGAERTKTWKNTIEDQRQARLQKMADQEAAKEQEIRELEQAWLEREKKKADAVQEQYRRHKELDNDYMRMFRSAKITADCLKDLAETKRIKEERRQAELQEGLQEKETAYRLYKEEVDANAEKALAQRTARERVDRVNLAQTQKGQYQREEERRERENELVEMRRLKALDEELHRKEYEDTRRRNMTCRSILDKQVEEKKKQDNIRALEEMATDLEIQMVQQKLDERHAIHEARMKSLKEKKAAATEIAQLAVAKQIKADEERRINSMLRCEGQDITNVRAEEARQARAAKYKKLEDEARKINEFNVADKFARKAVEEMADLEYNQKQHLEHVREAEYEKMLAEEKRAEAKRMATETLAEIAKLRLAREKEKEFESFCDKCAVLKDQREARELVERCRKMAEAEEDERVRRAYAIVIRNINRRDRSISW